MKKRGDEITFLRKIVPGRADESYGIQVAKLAGVPDDVVERAKAVLKELESKNSNKRVVYISEDLDDKKKEVGIEINEMHAKALEILKSIDATTLTPIEAMNILFELSKLVK